MASTLALLVPLVAILLGIVAYTDAGNDHFFQYANVPGWGKYEFGYNRGNHKHFTSRFEKAQGWTFKTKVRWGDKHGWGESYWDYNHADKGWGKKDHKKGWGHQGSSASSPVEQVADPLVKSSATNQERYYRPQQIRMPVGGYQRHY